MSDVLLKNVKHYLFSVFLLASFAGAVIAQPLQMVVQPNLPPSQTKQVYQPLADYLTQQLNQEVQLIVPRNFQSHWRDIKNGAIVDLAIEEAPLTDYRVNYKNFKPLVRGENSTSYSLVSLDSSYNNRDDLVGLPVASMPAPSTGYLVLARWYDNPLSQAQIISSAISWDDAVQQIWEGEVEGAILPSKLAAGFPQLTTLDTSVLMPPLTVSASPELDPELVQSITDALLALNDNQGDSSVILMLNIQSFVNARPNEYRGYAEWLRIISGGSGF